MKAPVVCIGLTVCLFVFSVADNGIGMRCAYSLHLLVTSFLFRFFFFLFYYYLSCRYTVNKQIYVNIKWKLTINGIWFKLFVFLSYFYMFSENFYLCLNFFLSFHFVLISDFFMYARSSKPIKVVFISACGR